MGARVRGCQLCGHRGPAGHVAVMPVGSCVCHVDESCDCHMRCQLSWGGSCDRHVGWVM